MKRNKTVLVLVLLLVIGFASVSTTLVLNGVIGISNKKEDFKVIFTNAKLDGVEKKGFIGSTNKQTINYETNKLTTLNETTVLEYEVANTSRLYDASVSVTCNLVDDLGNATTSEFVNMEYTPNNMTVSAGETKSGSITTKLTKVSTEDKSIKVKCELNANATERESLGAEYIPPFVLPAGVTLAVDENSNGSPDIGEEIAIGEEHFYVISNTDTELNALAKYNLNVGNIYTSDWNLERTISSTEEGYGIQNANARGYVAGDTKYYGTVAFANKKGWPYENNATIDIKQYDGPVKETLYGESGYEKYIQNTIPNSSVRLITKTELETLGCSSIDQSCLLAPSWVYSTSYWTQAAGSSGSSAWDVCSDGGFRDYYDDDSSYGVRPVITIPLS